MSNLPAIIRATRASASALRDCQRFAREHLNAHRDGRIDDMPGLFAKWQRAQARYARAQAILAANPLPGDQS